MTTADPQPKAAVDDAAVPAVDVDTTKPKDFEGEVATTTELPSRELLDKLADYLVLDRDGKSHTFKSLYTGPNVARRVLVIFVRHFFCGNCQGFLSALSESITPEALLRLPVSTFITVIGCGDPALIDFYVKESGCPFPVYTDPKRAIFEELGMSKTLVLGDKPAYQRRSIFKSSVDSFLTAVSYIPSGLGLKSGDKRQVGGEFLFEPADVGSPVTTPTGGGEEGVSEGKTVTWCHRMRTTRDHAEIPELMEVLGLDGHGQPNEDPELWKKAVQTRKGTGLSMAGEINKLKAENGPDGI